MLSAVACALALRVCPVPPPPPADPWMGPDKLKHFFMAAFVQTAAYSATRSLRVEHGPALGVATGVTVTVSIGKELFDRRHTGLFSVKDLLWDAAGAAAATVVLSHVRR